MAAVFSSTTVRSACGLPSIVTPPIFWLMSTNSAGVIWPDLRARRPYSTPSFPQGLVANPRPILYSGSVHWLGGRGPKIDFM